MNVQHHAIHSLQSYTFHKTLTAYIRTENVNVFLALAVTMQSHWPSKNVQVYDNRSRKSFPHARLSKLYVI